MVNLVTARDFRAIAAMSCDGWRDGYETQKLRSRPLTPHDSPDLLGRPALAWYAGVNHAYVAPLSGLHHRGDGRRSPYRWNRCL